MNRRAFLSAFSTAAAAIAFDPERALWVPGKKLISIPKPKLTLSDFEATILLPLQLEAVRQMFRFAEALEREFQHEYRQDLAFVRGTASKAQWRLIQSDRW